MKILFLLVAIIATVIQLTQSAALRRKPKVYNALITTDQNLTPSRAFPVIQPHLQETYAYPSYSYRSAYAPLGLYNNGFQYGSASYNRFHNYPRLNPGLVEARNFFPRDEIHSTLPPISNDFGLPPSLVPINSFPFGNLAPYPYNSYPIVYDQFGGYSGYLPPYSFYPPGFEGIGSENGKKGAPKDEDEKKDSSSADESKGENGIEPSEEGDSSGSSGGNSNGSSGGGNSNGSSGGGNSNGSGESRNGSSGSGGKSGGNSGSSSSSSTSSSAKSSRSRNFDKPEYSQNQSLNENIKNFPNKDPTIPDIKPSAPVRVKPLNK